MRKIFTVLLACLMSIGWFCACSDKGEENIPSSDPTKIMIADFESEREISAYYYKNYFGRAELNRDKTYITNGNSSLKLTVAGDPSYSYLKDYFAIYNPYMVVETVSDFFEKKDFADVESIAVDIYNAADYEVEMDLLIRFDYLVNQVRYISLGSVKLPSKKWTNYTAAYPREKMKLTYETDRMTGFVFVFPNRPDVETEAPVVYLDNFYCRRTDTPVEVLSKTRKPNEFFFFNDKYDLMALDGCFAGCQYNTVPKLSLNNDLTYVFEGNRSLKVCLPASPKKHFFFEGWRGFTIDGRFLKDLQLETLDPDTTKIEFSIYNAGDSVISVVPYFATLTGSAHKYIDVPAGQWKHYSYTLRQFCTGDNGYTITDLSNVISLSFTFAEFFAAEEKVLYIDNFKLSI